MNEHAAVRRRRRPRYLLRPPHGLHAVHLQRGLSFPGKWVTREIYLNTIKSGELNYAKREIGPMQVCAYERMAMVRYQVNRVCASGSSIGCRRSDLYELIDIEWCAVWPTATTAPRNAQHKK